MKQDEIKLEDVKIAVGDRYGKIARNAGSCCAPPSTLCCGSDRAVDQIGKGIGYSQEDLEAVPEGSNLGLDCGNPIALASLKEGETVVDLGSGAGFDCFLAANRVGRSGKVIGVDMTPDMLDKARDNARKNGYENVEFRLGEIEHLPVADNMADVIISNCVINLSPDKGNVFREAFRVLKPGERLMVSDIVLLGELPAALRNSIEAYVGCLAGAVMKEEYLRGIEDAGFQDVKILGETPFHTEKILEHPEIKKSALRPDAAEKAARTISATISSIRVHAVKKAGVQ